MKATKDILEFDRWDRAALYILLAGAAIAVAVTTVVTPVISWFRGAALDVPMTSRVTVPELDAVGTAHGNGSYVITVATPSTASRVLDFVHGSLVLAVIILGLYPAWSVIRRIAAGEPFATGQVGRLRDDVEGLV